MPLACRPVIAQLLDYLRANYGYAYACSNDLFPPLTASQVVARPSVARPRCFAHCAQSGLYSAMLAGRHPSRDTWNSKCGRPSVWFGTIRASDCIVAASLLANEQASEAHERVGRVRSPCATESIAKRENCSVRKVNMTISLAFLAPNLVRAAIQGRLPHGMGVTRLADLPVEWSRQHQVLGLPAQ